MYHRMISEMAYHWRVRAMMAAQPIRKMYWTQLVFHERSLKLNLSENMGSSLTIRMSVTSETATRMQGNRSEERKAGIA